MRNAPLLTLAIGSLWTACVEPPAPPPQRSETLRVDEGGAVESPDGNFVLDVPPQSLIADTTFTVTQRPATDSFDPDATLSNVYEVEADGELAIVFRAELSFAVSAGEVERRGDALGVARGEVVGQDWDEVLRGEFDAAAGVYRAQTLGLSWFALVDDPDEDPPPACPCDVGPGCDADCDCDEACARNPGRCDAGCMDAPGAVCCEPCGACNAVEVACEPVCPQGATWDCELACCFDTAEGVCVD